MSKEQSWARGRTNGVTTPMCSGKIDKITTLTKAQSSRIVSLRSTPRTRHCPALPTRFDPFGVRGVVQRVRTERIAPGTSRGYSSRRSGLKRALRPGHWPGASPCWAPSEQLRAGSLPPGGGRAMPDDQLAGDGPFVVRAVTTSRSRRPPGRVPGSVIQRSWVVCELRALWADKGVEALSLFGVEDRRSASPQARPEAGSNRQWPRTGSTRRW